MGTVFKSLGVAFLVIAFGGLAAFAGSPVPDTGQTTCYDTDGNVVNCEGTGQDGEFSINPHSYTSLGGGKMVRDNVTGLIWEIKGGSDGVANYDDPNDPDNTYDWYESTTDFIAAMNGTEFGGQNDWRLPTVKELSFLVDAERHDPAIDIGAFPSTRSGWYWSSLPLVFQSDRVWDIRFKDGYVGTSEISDGNNFVRAVRGGEEQLGPYVDNGDGTVTDTNTGLMWQQATQATTYSWQEALNQCNGLSLAGQTDWRLPNRNELQSLAYYGFYNPAIHPFYFLPTYDELYWSSSSKAGDPGKALSVYFGTGSVDNNVDKNDQYRFRAVRGGQSRLAGHLIIIEPDQGDLWEVGETMPIVWEDLGIGGNIEIVMSRQGGAAGTFSTIVGSTPNDGAHNWTVTGPFSANCVLKIIPLSDSSKETSQGLFTIAETTLPAAVISGAPPAYTNQRGVVLQVGGNVINYYYRVNGGVYTALPAHISETIELTELSDGIYTVDVVGKDVRGDTQGTPTTVSWTVDTVPPAPGAIAIANTGGKTSDPTPDISISSTEADLMRFALSSSELAAAPWIPFATTYAGIDVSAGGNGVKEVYAQFKDLAGNTTAGIYDSVYYESEIPAVIVSANTIIVDEPSGTNTFTIHLNTHPTAQVTISLSRENQQCTVTPSLTFTPQNWDSPQSVTVEANDDGLIDGTQNCIIQISADSTDPDYQLPEAKTVEILVNDNPLAGIQILSLYPAMVKTGEETTFTVRGAGFGTPASPRVDSVAIRPEGGGTETPHSGLTVFDDDTLQFTLSTPVEEGDYTLILTVSGVPEEMDQALTLKEVLPVYKAVIVLGQAGPNAPVWEPSRDTAHKAYRTLLESGFLKENIHYLSAEGNTDLDGDGEPDDWDGPADLATVGTAIDRCAGGDPADQFVLYMIGDGSSGQFRLGGTEVLPANTLNGWLNNGLASSVVNEMIVLYDACYSGSFIPPLANLPNRVIITSTDADSLAYIEEGHSFSFSTLFWFKINARYQVGPSFDYASGEMPDQTPLIDYDSGEVDAYTLFIGRGGIPMTDTPNMGPQPAPATILADHTTNTVTVGPVTDTQGIKRVWATVRTPCEKNREIVFTVQADGGMYEGLIDRLIFNGTYNVIIRAEDTRGNLCDPSLQTTLTKTDGVQCHEPDLTLDGNIDLADAILGLKILSGAPYRENPADSYEDLDIDVGGDLCLGLEEVVYILKAVGN